MSVNQNESTAKSAAYGAGVDMISNPISGTSFTEPVAFSAPVVMNTSASINTITTSGVMNTTTSGLNFYAFQSGAATGGSGGTFSGLDPVTWIPVRVSGNALRIPVFT